MFALACSRLSVVEDERKRAREKARVASPPFFSLARFRSFPTTESLEQAMFAQVLPTDNASLISIKTAKEYSQVANVGCSNSSVIAFEFGLLIQNNAS